MTAPSPERDRLAPLTNAEPEPVAWALVKTDGTVCSVSTVRFQQEQFGEWLTVVPLYRHPAPVAVVGREISTGRAVEEIEDAADNYFEQPLNGDRMGFTVAVRAIVEALVASDPRVDPRVDPLTKEEVRVAFLSWTGPYEDSYFRERGKDAATVRAVVIARAMGVGK